MCRAESTTTPHGSRIEQHHRPAAAEAPVSRDAPSRDRLTGWHMLALVGSAAEVRRRARGAAGDFISEGGRDARTYLYVDGAKWGHTASIVDCALKAFGCPTPRIQVAGKQLPEFPSSSEDGLKRLKMPAGITEC